MQYFGGKFRLASKIGFTINELKGSRDFYEPFCGGLWVTKEISGKRYCSDISAPLITLYRSLASGWIPPEFISLDDYEKQKRSPYPEDPLTAFIGYGCSFGGKYFGGYARGHKQNYAFSAKRSLLKKFETCKDVEFSCASYFDIMPQNAFIYCDPPYSGTTGYAKTGTWNPTVFWNKCRDWVKEGNIVLISEYVSPADFVCVESFDTKTDIRTKGGKESRVEKLFLHESQCQNLPTL